MSKAIHKNGLKTKLHAQLGTDGHLTIKNYFHDLVQYPENKFAFAFPQPRYVLRMFFNFRHFSVSCSYKTDSCKKK